MISRYRGILPGLALLATATLLAANFGGGGGARASAGTASVTPQATPTEITDLGLSTSIFDSAIGANQSISWSAIPGVATYRLVLELQLGAVSAIDPVCGKASQPAIQQLKIEEDLPGTASSFEIPFPSLPAADTWVVGSFNVSLRAFGQDGSQLGGQGRIGTGSAGPGRVCATSTVAPMPRTPSVALPGTGLRGSEELHTSRIAYGLLVIAAAAFLLLSFGFSRRT